MANFIMRPVKGKLLGAESKTYPHLIKVGDTSTDELARRISLETSFSPGDVKGLLSALASALARDLASGHTLHIDGLGTFRALLTLREDAEPEEMDAAHRRNAASVRIGKVSFIPDEELLWEANRHADLHRVTEHPRRRQARKEERRSRLLKYLEENPSITVKEYAALTGLSRTTASRELSAIAAEEESPIRSEGSASHSRYVPSEEEPLS